MTTAIQNEIDFYRYPSIGTDDWRYAWQTANVRVMELSMIPRGTFVEMANAESYADAVEMLTGTAYAIDADAGADAVEEMLKARRTEARQLFAEMMLEKGAVKFLRMREDFTNMRLAIRRVVTERPLGLDYSDEGNVPAEEFQEIFEQENYERFPEYLQDGVEAAVLGYYVDKDIRRIDYELDRVEMQSRLLEAARQKNTFILALVKLRIDLYNIRTMLRLKMADRSEETHLFVSGGYVDLDRFRQGLDVGYETLGQLFFATPYYELLETAIPYLRSEQSFLRLEKECEDFIKGFLKTTRTIASGPQPIIAYFLMKEAEIRNVRMVLTGKKNGLSPKLILDRLGEWM